MSQEPIAEYLSAEEVPEDQPTSLAPLGFSEPLEQFQILFNEMAGIRAKVILWEQKTVITNPKTRDEAIRLRTTVTSTAKAIEDAYLSITEPARNYLKEVRQMATQAQIALVGTKDDKSLGVAGRLTTKISNFAADCLRIEEEMKAKALAEQRRVEAEIEAKRKEEQAKEVARQLEEDRRIKEIEDAKIAQANAEGRTETDQLEADVATEEEMGRIEADRAQRKEAMRLQEIEDKKKIDEQERKTLNTMAIATAKGQVKGVQEVWSIELMDESLVPRNLMSYDEKKARAWLKGGFHDKKEKDAEKIIPGLRCVIVLGKGGK